MKKLLFITFAVWCAFVRAQLFSPEDIANIAATEKIKHEKKHLIQKSSNAGNNINIIYTRAYWQIDPAINYIIGKVTHYFIATKNLQSITLDLSTSLIIDSIKYHNTSAFYQQLPGDVLQINFPSQIAANTVDSACIYYQGPPTSSGFGSFLINTHNGIPVQWTLSEPYGAKDWWPCKLSLTDKIDSIDIVITTPQAYRAASNGLLINEYVNGSNKTYHWQHRYPITAYLVFISITNYAVYSDWVHFSNGDSLEILNYVFPEDSLLATTTLNKAVEVMQLFDSLFTPYPFINEKYGHAQFKWGGGMEHQTMSSMGGFNFELVAHELAHQWFGNKITCGSWADLWLNEGFATYLSGLCYEHLFNGYWWPIWKKNTINNVTAIPYGSVYVTDTNDINRLFNGRLTYAKAAYLLHMLRWTVGDENFYTAIKNYLNDPLLSYGYAKSHHLKYHLEIASGLDLTAFFEDWLYGQGWPSYTIEWYQDTDNYISIVINQSPSHTSVDFFEMKLPLVLKNNTQQAEYIVQHNYNKQTFYFHVPFKVDSLKFDPQLWILSANNQVIKQSIDDSFFEAQLYPNPTQDETQLWISLKNNKQIMVSISDAVGKIVYQTKTLSLFPGNHPIVLPLQWLAKGSYFVHVYTEGKQHKSFKLLKI